ncbi:MAG TPA: response regulator, partial [Acidimicrobiales bacterium]|nr:response regulator [Acidimicrobiales bacterium]
ELAKEHHPDLVLLDLHLPDMTGSDVLQQLRDDPGTTNVPVVVVSADATAAQVRRLRSNGAMAYFTKPIDVHELLSAVEMVAARGTS